jgi:hypothetical protein
MPKLGWSTAELSEDTGAPEATIAWYRAKGVLVPVERRPTRLGGDVWGVEAALGLATARALRRLGVRLSDCVGIFDWLVDVKKAELAREFAAGRSWLRIAGDKCEAVLLTAEEALQVDGAAARAVQPAAVDVRQLLILLAGRHKKRSESGGTGRQQQGRSRGPLNNPPAPGRPPERHTVPR